jgi:hypothetical protein
MPPSGKGGRAAGMLLAAVVDLARLVDLDVPLRTAYSGVCRGSMGRAHGSPNGALSNMEREA